MSWSADGQGWLGSVLSALVAEGDEDSEDTEGPGRAADDDVGGDEDEELLPHAERAAARAHEAITTAERMNFIALFSW